MNPEVASELAPELELMKRRLRRKPRPATKPRPSAENLPEIEQQILEEAGRALREWKSSPEGQATLASLRTDGLEELRLNLSTLVASSIFAPTRELIDRQQKLDASKISFPIKSISIGFSAEIDLFGGVYGSIGYAADPDDPLNTSIIYLCGALIEGVIEGGDADLQVGLWKSKASDLGGYYNGQTIDLEDGVGLEGWSLEQDDSVVAYLIDVGVGEDDGLAEVEFYMLTFGITRPPVAQADASHFLILKKLQCLNTSESGHDEVFFNFRPDNGTTYPYPTWNYYAMSADSKDPESSWNCGRSVKFNGKVDVTLMDGESTLGSFTFNYSDFSQPGVTITKTSDVKNGLNEIKYEMTAQLIY